MSLDGLSHSQPITGVLKKMQADDRMVRTAPPEVQGNKALGASAMHPDGVQWVEPRSTELGMVTANTTGQTVHQRTLKGQRAAAMQIPTLDIAHARLLLLFNGFTPTEYLVARAEEFAPQQARLIADELERNGLIERVH